MASNDAFLPQSATLLVTTSGTTLTPLSQAVSFPGVAPAVMGPLIPPPTCLIENISTGVIWISITLAARTAAIPASGQTSFEIPVPIGAWKVFRTPWGQGSSGSEQTTPGVATFNINTIAVGLSLQITCTFGEGL